MLHTIISYIFMMFFLSDPSMTMEDRENHVEKTSSKPTTNIMSKSEEKNIEILFENSDPNSLVTLSDKEEMEVVRLIADQLSILNDSLIEVCGKDKNNTRLKLSSLNYLVSDDYNTETKLWNACSKKNSKMIKERRDSIRETLNRGSWSFLLYYLENVINLMTLKNALNAKDPLYCNTYANYGLWASGCAFYGSPIPDEKKTLMTDTIDQILEGMKKRRNIYTKGNDDKKIEEALRMRNL